MTSFQWLTVMSFIVLSLAILGGAWFRKKYNEKEIINSRKIFSFWAALGPFKSGEESAAAMRSAHLEILGPVKAEKIKEGLSKHATAFDSNPEGWEKTRREALHNLKQAPEK